MNIVMDDEGACCNMPAVSLFKVPFGDKCRNNCVYLNVLKNFSQMLNFYFFNLFYTC